MLTRSLVRQALVIGALCCLGLSARLSAQISNSGVAFDSAGRVVLITPATAELYGFRAPAWPVTGAFTEARIARQESGGFVLLVTRPNGTVDRLPLLDEQRDALRVAISRAEQEARARLQVPSAAAAVPSPARSETPPLDPNRRVQERTTLEGDTTRDEKAANRWVGGQIAMGALVYAPLLSGALYEATEDKALSSIVLVGTVTGSILGATRYAASRPINLAQSFVSTHAAIHGALAGAALVYIAGADSDLESTSAYRLAPVAGGIAGTAAGLAFGRRLSETEAVASGVGADLAIAAAYLLTPEADTIAWDHLSRPRTSAMLGAMLAGYAFGPLYPRRASFSVSPGDITALAVAAGVGAFAGGTVIVDSDASPRAAGLSILGGMAAGLVAGNYLLVREFDHTHTQAGLLAAAAAGGAFAVASIPGVADEGETSARRTMTFATVGAVAGAALMERAFRLSAPVRTSRSSVNVRLHPAGIVGAALGSRRPPSLLTITF